MRVTMLIQDHRSKGGHMIQTVSIFTFPKNMQLYSRERISYHSFGGWINSNGKVLSCWWPYFLSCGIGSRETSLRGEEKKRIQSMRDWGAVTVLGPQLQFIPVLSSVFTQDITMHLITRVCACSVVCHVQLFVIPWTVVCQIPLSMEFCRQEYWSGLPFPPPGDLPNPRTEPVSPALADGFFTTEPPGKPLNLIINSYFYLS